MSLIWPSDFFGGPFFFEPLVYSDDGNSAFLLFAKMACGTSFVFSPYFPSTDNRSIVLVWLEIDTKNKTFRRFT